MYPPTSEIKKDKTFTLKILIGVLGVSTIVLLATTIVLALNRSDPSNQSDPALATSFDASAGINFMQSKASSNCFSDTDDNVCERDKLAFENKLCAELELAPQAGANVTKGYVVGNMDVGDIDPKYH